MFNIKQLIMSNFCPQQNICCCMDLSNYCAKLFDNQGMATKNLIQLLDVIQVKISGDKNIQNIQNSSIIQSWRSHPGLERWHLELPTNLKGRSKKIIALCENQLGMKERILPKNIKYSGILFLGAAVDSVLTRTHFYNNLLANKKIDENLKVWVLTGERELDHTTIEHNQNLLKLAASEQRPLPLPNTELEMIKFIFHYLMPKNISVEYVYGAKDPNHTRATTISVVKTWIPKIPEPPTEKKHYYLAISNQPYVDYQASVINATLKNLNKKNIVVHVVGDKAKKRKNHDNYAAILLDTVSKIIGNCEIKSTPANSCCEHQEEF